MLPHEADAVRQIWPTIRDEYNRTERMHDAFVAAFFAKGSLKIKKRRGLRPIVTTTVLGLLTKALKTSRSIQHLAKNGLGADALALTRVLLETATISMFILRKSSLRRTAMYHTHRTAQMATAISKRNETPGLKRLYSAKLVGDAVALRDRLSRWLPPGAKVYGHWSGKGTLEHGIELIPGGRKAYQLVYRDLSPFVHGTDFHAHVTFDADEDPIFNIPPSDAHLKQALAMSQLYLWLMVDGINGRLGLGFDDILETHRPEFVKKPTTKRTAT